MPQPSEHKSVQARILKYAQEIGWIFVKHTESEERRYFDKDGATPRDRARNASLFYNDLLYEKVLEFNPKYVEDKGELIKKFNLLHTDIFGNRDFLKYLREEQKFYCKSENRELDLKLIDYDVISNNVYEVTEEFYYRNGRFGNREDVVFLINGIPVLVIECKSATRDEAIAKLKECGETVEINPDDRPLTYDELLEQVKGRIIFHFHRIPLLLRQCLGKDINFHVINGTNNRTCCLTISEKIFKGIIFYKFASFFCFFKDVLQTDFILLQHILLSPLKARPL